jgi:hypothetical protein
MLFTPLSRNASPCDTVNQLTDNLHPGQRLLKTETREPVKQKVALVNQVTASTSPYLLTLVPRFNLFPDDKTLLIQRE